jgi:hypothetical protein
MDLVELLEFERSGGCHGKGDRDLHTNELPETVEGGSSSAIWKDCRVLSASEEIGLVSQ